MEIEAKFSIPDRVAFDRLCQIKELAGYRLRKSSVERIQDRYMDTDERAILRAGFACRVRRSEKTYIATLKGLGGADAASGIHRRAEYEVPVDQDDPTTWPASAVRDLVLELSAGGQFNKLLILKQERHTRLLYDDTPKGTRQVAELSLDVVTFGGSRAPPCYELEIELLDQGKPADLKTLADELIKTWGLRPELRSKFERGLALVDGGARSARLEDPMQTSLSVDEKRALTTWIETGNAPVQRRARILLLKDAGYDNNNIAAEIGLSSRQVRHWLAAFRAERMGIFPKRADSEIREPETREPEAQAKVSPSDEVEEEQVAVLEFEAWPELEAPGLLPNDPMSEAGRKTLWFHFLRMLKHEPGTRLGEDIEALHDMRVATRRMRAAFRVFGDFFEPEVVRPFKRDLRRVARTLGAVRDLDVFEEKAKRYLKALPKGEQDGLDPLIESWHTQREAARAKMIAFLDGDRYQKFVRRFAAFLQTQGAGARPTPRDRPTPYQVRHLAPRLIYDRYETVRAYETVLDDAQIETLHALRIDCKYLRYTLEFLSEVLGPEAKMVIDEVKKMQDHLGDLNDAEVAIGLVNDFLRDWDTAQSDVPLSQRRSAEEVVTYMASRHGEKHRLMTTFPEAWDKLNRDEVRRWLALAVAAL